MANPLQSHAGHRGSGGARPFSGKGKTNNQERMLNQDIRSRRAKKTFTVGKDQLARFVNAEKLRDALATPANMKEIAEIIMAGCRDGEKNTQVRFVEIYLNRAIGMPEQRLAYNELEHLVEGERRQQLVDTAGSEPVVEHVAAPEPLTDIAHLVTDTTPEEAATN